MGGLVATAADRMFPLESITTIGTPHGGTIFAKMGFFSTSARQMALGSEFIKENWATSTNGRLYSIGCKLDEVCRPLETAIHPHSERSAWFRHNHLSVVYSGKVADSIVDFCRKP